jgi:hypothetical protein
MHLPDIGNTLRGYALQPDASNMFGGYAYMLTLAFTHLVPHIGKTLGGCALHAAKLSSPPHSILHFKQHIVYHVYSIDTFWPNGNDLTSRRF